MITLFNPDKVSRQPFFQALINYLSQREDVTLRQIKKDFPEVKQVDRCLETYIQAGYIMRKDRRYYLSLPLLEDLNTVHLEDMVFVDSQAAIYPELLAKSFETRLTNPTNQVIILERTTISRESLSLANYFYRLKRGEKPSAAQAELYELLGDVNPDYALKYLTSYLLKFVGKDQIKQKRPDIFCQALVLLSYLIPVGDSSYRLGMEMDPEKLIFKAK
ncbi:DUF1803 domain-containing protein [Streptococcus didelphis]|uniref:DUF1803 domain-containing protein n=1 Tax=Streptococcus didelphis TaxID=102886 RepID=UPI0003736D94|nr:DUF1803 domain-containing protein [Streptococcus didelphis]